MPQSQGLVARKTRNHGCIGGPAGKDVRTLGTNGLMDRQTRAVGTPVYDPNTPP